MQTCDAHTSEGMHAAPAAAPVVPTTAAVYAGEATTAATSIATAMNVAAHTTTPTVPFMGYCHIARGTSTVTAKPSTVPSLSATPPRPISQADVVNDTTAAAETTAGTAASTKNARSTRRGRRNNSTGAAVRAAATIAVRASATTAV